MTPPVVYRLWWWVTGSPDNRPGGPWWYKDFNSLQECEQKLIRMSSCIYAWGIEENPVPHEDNQPPTDLLLQYPQRKVPLPAR